MKYVAMRALSTSLVVLSFTSAHAQTPSLPLRLWVASYGSDSSTACAFASPCQTFNRALQIATPGSEIDCIDSVAAEGLGIDKSVTINCEGAMATTGQKLNTWVFGITNISVGATDTVVLRGLHINYQRSGFSFNFSGAGKLVLEKMHIGGGQNGIMFAPNGPAHLVVKDSTIDTNGNGSSGAGIRVVPSGNGSARVTLERVTVTSNTFGIAVDGTDSTAGINATISNSTMSSNANDGIVAVTSEGHAPIGVTVTNSRSTNNGYGIRSIGPNVTVRVKNSEIVGNGIGLKASSSGALLTLGNNTVEANGSDGAFTGSVAQK